MFAFTLAEAKSLLRQCGMDGWTVRWRQAADSGRQEFVIYDASGWVVCIVRETTDGWRLRDYRDYGLWMASSAAPHSDAIEAAEGAHSDAMAAIRHGLLRAATNKRFKF